ncbi:hypothetical protein UPYG_G00024310 [Umbra pygmaea]|uniref:Testis-specific gene 10 protein-like n=1 Tax=Umbra pygmaea TaxID=75934 RepID=A0ABD0XPI9_UMBPY
MEGGGPGICSGEKSEDHTKLAESITENLQKTITSPEGTITEVTSDGDLADIKPTEVKTQLNIDVDPNQEGDLQALLDQLHLEIDRLNRLVQRLTHKGPTERKQGLYTRPDGGRRLCCLGGVLQSVEEESYSYGQETDGLTRMLRDKKACSQPSQGHSPTRQSPVKGGSYDSELIRVLRERDEMQNILEKYERHMSEIQANVKVLTGDRDKTMMHYQQAQEEIASLRREVLKSKSPRTPKGSVSAQSILKRVEAEKNEATFDLHRMSTERDSLRERLKISQETAISERAHLEQRVEELQTAILSLEQERGELKNHLAVTKDNMMGLEAEIHTLRNKLTLADEELSRSRNECAMLRLSNSESKRALINSHRRLTSRIGDLQNSQERNKLQVEKNDGLLRQVSGLTEEMKALQTTICDMNQTRDSLKEQLNNKSNLLNSTHNQLEDQENTIRNLRRTVKELETSVESVEGELAGRVRELEELTVWLEEAREELGSTVKVKDATLRENAQLREDLDKTCLDNQALKLKSDDSAQEVQELQKKVQDYMADVSRIENLLSAKERERREHQEAQRRLLAQAESWEVQARQEEARAGELRLELVSSDMERRRLKERVETLEASLHEMQCAEQSCSSQVSQLTRSLVQAEEELRRAQGECSTTQTDLDRTRELCVKLDASKETLQRELDTCHSEVKLLRKQLSSELLNTKSLETMLVSTREKELHTHRRSQDRDTENQMLRDKLSVADSMASSHTREVAMLRTRSAHLESDLDKTKRQLSTERFERLRAVQELRRQGLSCSASGLHSSSPLPHLSLSPRRILPPPADHLARDGSPDRTLGFMDLY